MNEECAPVILFCFQLIISFVKNHEIPIYNIYPAGQSKPHTVVRSSERIHEHNCFYNYKWVNCVTVNNYNYIKSFTKKILEEQIKPYQHFSDPREYNKMQEFHSIVKSFFAEPINTQRFFTHVPGIMRIRSLPDMQGRFPVNNQIQIPGYSSSNFFNQAAQPDLKHNFNYAMSTLHSYGHSSSGLSSTTQSSQMNTPKNAAHNQMTVKPSVMTGVSSTSHQIMDHKNMSNLNKFTQSLDQFERHFYKITFSKLTSISPADRQENGISFVQSGIFLLLTLLALSTEVDHITRTEINRCIRLQVTDTDAIDIVKHFMASLPESSDKLKFRLSSRLVLWPGTKVSQKFRDGPAAALMLQVEEFFGNETSDRIATILNKKVEMDSGGAIHDTFDEDDVAGGVTAVLVTTLYIRGSWRVAPTVLNGSRTFHDHESAPKRTVRMIKINDMMKYADLREWDAQAIEISYATPGLSLLMLIPRGTSLRSLVHHVTNTSMGELTAKMRPMRVAAIVPLYTLRMTLLLPNKLQALKIQSLVDVANKTHDSSLRLSHAVQRIMFWAEAGRNAYKDDGIEWDLAPDVQVVVDRPYIFFVRWRNITLLNGNFVL